MKNRKPHFRPGAPASALVTLATAPNAVARPSGARVALKITESEAARCGLLDRWQAAMQRRRKREQKIKQVLALLNGFISRLLAKAKTEEWSQRELAAKIGIPETTFRRIRGHAVNPLVWLPKIEAAAARLNL